MLTSRQLKYRAKLTAAMTMRRNPTLAYLGWVGEGNIGDESIRLAQKLIFAHLRFAAVPVHDAEWILSTSKRLRDGALPSRLLVGGGTVIGRPEWLARLQSYTSLRPDCEVLVWGAGVEDPDFGGSRTHASRDTIKSWSSVLQGVSAVGVRGPRSAELLAEAGVPSTIVGDPALALRPTNPVNLVREGVVALNLGMVEDRYQTGETNHHEWNAELVASLTRIGFEVQPFTMAPGDSGMLQRAISESGCTTATVKQMIDPQEAVDWLSTVDGVISQRLHGSVLAAAARTPFLSLDYRPKCADFAASIGRPDLNYRGDMISPSQCAETMRHLLSNRAREAISIESGVTPLRKALHSHPLSTRSN